MEIRRSAQDLTEPKTLKVRIPKDLHMRLHEIKIIEGRNIQDTVTAALAAYFDTEVDLQLPGDL